MIIFQPGETPGDSPFQDHHADLTADSTPWQGHDRPTTSSLPAAAGEIMP
jgi:hypothetical protein